MKEERERSKCVIRHGQMVWRKKGQITNQSVNFHSRGKSGDMRVIAPWREI